MHKKITYPLNLIWKIAGVIIAALIIILSGNIRTSDAAIPSGDWESGYVLMTETALRNTAQEFLAAYQAQDMTAMKQVCPDDMLDTFKIDTSEEDNFRRALVKVFGDKKNIDKTIQRDIAKFSEDLYHNRIKKTAIETLHVRDNHGVIEATVTATADPTVIGTYDITETVSKATSEYSDKHEEELIDSYKETQDDSAITKMVIKGIYKKILNKLSSEYAKEAPVTYTLTLAFDLDEEGNYVMSDASWSDQEILEETTQGQSAKVSRSKS